MNIVDFDTWQAWAWLELVKPENVKLSKTLNITLMTKYT
jgi:hypothetical protein